MKSDNISEVYLKKKRNIQRGGGTRTNRTAFPRAMVSKIPWEEALPSTSGEVLKPQRPSKR